MKVDVVEGGGKSGLSPDSALNKGVVGVSMGNSPKTAGAPANNNNNDTKDPDADLKLSSAQWRQLLAGSPSTETAAKFLQAHGRGFIGDGDFYAITFELLKSQSSQQQKLALYILSQDSTLSAFPNMAKEYPQLTPDMQAQVWTIMSNYANPEHFLGLARALAMKDPVVVTMATQVLNMAVAHQVSLLTQSQGSARGVAGQQAAQSLRIFVPTLTQLAQSPDSQNAAAAQTLLAEIQSLIST